MELPLELQMIINDYARPIGRPDWRLGSYMMRALSVASKSTYTDILGLFKAVINHCSHTTQIYKLQYIDCYNGYIKDNQVILI